MSRNLHGNELIGEIADWRDCFERNASSLVLLIEMPILLGVLVPHINGLAAIALGLNAAVFHLIEKVGITVVEKADVPFKYLWISIVLNYALLT